ncbi:MAG: transglycosylase SLT domain-containing protein, partial [Nanoarchaeota archaeon]|nr:transglycosylase SLT domain-containing protein [Nanoarchaeota archaeon]
DSESLLGDESIITRYFRVSTKYIYELEKTTPVEVAETEGYEAAPDIDELKKMKDSEEIKKECDSIESCDDYNNEDKHYDLYGFSIRVWCEADPCDLKNCYWDEGKMKCLEKEEEIPIAEEWRSYDDSEVELKIRGAAVEYGFPEKVLLGIAKTEGGGKIRHYDDEGNVMENKETGCIGVMQILTENNWCSSCSKTKEELKDINTNIECGIKILKGKYNLFCDAGGNTRIRESGKSDYQEKVEFWCKIPVYVNKYLEYDKDCDKMAIRGYNGLGCDKNADTSYVEKVMNYAEGFA